MKKDVKRYLVTYADGGIATAEAEQILNLSGKTCHEGVSFLESDVKPSEDDVLHFEKVGISSLSLTEAQIKTLEKDDRILAVEEDTEMHILEIDPSASDFGGETLTYPDYYEDQSGDGYSSGQETYQTGYKQAMVDMFSSMLDLGSSQQAESNVAGGLPILPNRPILRPLPFPIPFPRIPILRQPIPWNINLVKAPRAWSRGITGSGVKVAVLDTGIAAHPDLVISGGVSFVPGVVSYNDGHSHGTHCAGIIGARNNFTGVVGVAPNCNLYAVKVLADSGSGSSSWIISGMDWCISRGMHVASMSLGGTSAPSVAYANAVKRCQDAGVTVVIASGNSFGTSFPWVNAPANSIIPGVSNASPIAVGSVNSSCVIASSSSRGGQTPIWNQVQTVAPGVSINSTVLGGNYGLKSGTSMATPHVAGQVALIKQRFPGASVPFVKSRIYTTCTNLGTAGYDTTFGHGLINCDLATL